MTTTTYRPRFSKARISTYVRCLGRNHRDEGELGTCTTCLASIARVTRPDGTKRLYDVNGRYNAADNYVYDYACWNHPHTCDPTIAAAVQAERDAKIAAGEIAVIGQNVTVIRGRKIPKGTKGIVFWVGDDVNAYTGDVFAKVGIKTESNDHVFVKADYCTVTPTTSVDDCLDALAGVNMPTPGANDKPATPRTSGSHAGCTHAATKSARAACRKARAR